MNLGQKYRVMHLQTITNKMLTPVPLVGTVIYVHPERRFAVLEFECINGKSRESFRPEELRGRQVRNQEGR